MKMRVYGFLNEQREEDNIGFIRDGKAVSPDQIQAGDELVLFVRGESITQVSAVLPSRLDKEAYRAAPFAVEDEIATSIDDCHFALGAAPENLETARQIQIVSVEQMEAWSDLLRAQPHLMRAKLVAEQSVLPEETVLRTPDRFISNLNGRAATIDARLTDTAIHMLIGDHTPKHVRADELLGELARFGDASSELIDLRQGNYANRENVGFGHLSSWRLTGALAAALLVVWAGSTYMDIRSLNTQSDTIEAQIADAYAGVFPNEPKPRNYVRAVARAVDESGGRSKLKFDEASAELYAALLGLPSSELRSIRYDYDQGILVARIAHAAYGDETVLKDMLSSKYLSVTLGGAAQENGRVVGDVTLQRTR
jgi:general secretion pathway protein L